MSNSVKDIYKAVRISGRHHDEVLRGKVILNPTIDLDDNSVDLYRTDEDLYHRCVVSWVWNGDYDVLTDLDQVDPEDVIFDGRSEDLRGTPPGSEAPDPGAGITVTIRDLDVRTLRDVLTKLPDTLADQIQITIN